MKFVVALFALLLLASVCEAQYPSTFNVMPGHGYTQSIPTYYGYPYGYGYNNYGTIERYRMGTADFYYGTGAFSGLRGQTFRFDRAGRYGYSQFGYGW